MAILNVIPTVEEIDIRERLMEFRYETEGMPLPVCHACIFSPTGHLNPVTADEGSAVSKCPFRY